MAVQSNQRHHRFAAMLGAVALALTAAAPAFAAVRPTVERDIHFEEVHYFPGSDCGPGSTEIATGNSHTVVVDDGTMLHVQFMETFQVRMIWDDPTMPDGYRQGTDALTFQLTRNGTQVFHESFHDFGPAAFLGGADAQIQLFVTFVAKDGVVRVDHFFARDLPPDGC
jgi:hypothetical protein